MITTFTVKYTTMATSETKLTVSDGFVSIKLSQRFGPFGHKAEKRGLKGKHISVMDGSLNVLLQNIKMFTSF